MSVEIYKITNKLNNKCYIGQNTFIEKRWKDEVNGQINSLIFNDFKKYGLENFSFEILEECENGKLNELEKKYIEKFDSVKNGYNIQPGGYGSGSGRTLEEQKEHHRNEMKEWRKNNSKLEKKIKHKYWEKNKVKIKAKRKENWDEYYKKNKQHYKEYYEKNKKELIEKAKKVNKQLCLDPVKNDICTIKTLRWRKQNHKEEYKEVVVINCKIDESLQKNK